MQASNAYTGHGARTGGLQSHSIGALYPFDVYGQETPAGTRYGVVDLARGVWTGARWTCGQAATLAEVARASSTGADLIARITADFAELDRTARAHQKSADAIRVAGWIAAGFTLAEVRARANGTRAARLFELIWGWSAPRFGGPIGAAQDRLYDRDRGAYARRMRRVKAIAERLRHSASAYAALHLGGAQ